MNSPSFASKAETSLVGVALRYFFVFGTAGLFLVLEPQLLSPDLYPSAGIAVFLWLFVAIVGGALNLDPLIKSEVQSGAGPNIDKKVQLFQSPLAFCSTMEGVCSAQVQAQNEQQLNTQRLKDRSLSCQATFADINIAKS
jgi:hypothetical protein